MDFNGRKGFIRLALEKDVPIVPVVSIGGQETALFLSRGERLARLLRLDRLFRLKVLPISLALPWGLNIGDMLGHVPLPAKITIEVLPPIDLREEFGERPRPRRGLRRGARPDAGDARRLAGGAPPAGDRLMRVEEHDHGRRAARARSGSCVSDPASYPRFMEGITRWERRGRARSRASARATRC